MANDLVTRNNDWFDPLFVDDWDRFFNRGFKSVNNMLTDVKETKDNYTVAVDIPGVDKKQIHLDYHNDELKVSYHNEHTNEEKDKEGHVIHSERKYGSFQRIYTFPDINPEEITAEYVDGVLHITLPKRKPAERDAKRIEIK
ncbi:Hsp20/alpha crystallin family protein [Xylocopilactobacillus apicola]|uniref:Molecular chaperone n=1 Tax=Xylocopilactobacillus apicola TaxID=2932184 RepID=A0AAU9DR77_9LACO|nr:Hsp20/alpha crystallin family protein [Xylocopilactobacillus apicola]BDR59727.1 molecular chaperone [Xylocopilactobacillus apicola]